MDESKKAKKMPWSAEDQLRKVISARGKQNKPQHLSTTWSMRTVVKRVLLTPTPSNIAREKKYEENVQQIISTHDNTSIHRLRYLQSIATLTN
ncbi:hypothetical protein T4E_4715 [Trichinella pseudospiralis]|uniref:Uncharacterized protein n=1 Tax=Trichinella pseudospiralis TaxID=6337 RepID=A0A0V0XSJ8_TRIPS|nr:hypothetical protein T4E_4715 [Trichinella pseudospiralis]